MSEGRNDDGAQAAHPAWVSHLGQAPVRQHPEAGALVQVQVRIAELLRPDQA